jgi:hypothetical protein
MEKILEKTTQLDVEEFYSKFPHLEKRITFQWGTQECRDFLLSLTGYFEATKDRKSRQGFSVKELLTILHLLARHDSEFPQFDRDDDDAPFSSYADFEEKRPAKSKFMEYQEQQKQHQKTNWANIVWLIILAAIAVAYLRYK